MSTYVYGLSKYEGLRYSSVVRSDGNCVKEFFIGSQGSASHYTAVGSIEHHCIDLVQQGVTTFLKRTYIVW